MKNKEIERKFIINPENIPFDLNKMDYRDITQGYVTSIDKTFIFRLRHVLYRSHLDGDLLGEEFFQTIKGKGTKIRDEFEIKLWKNQFSQLYSLCNDKQIHKFRFELPCDNNIHRIYLDQYKNELNGLWTLEVEFDSVKECDSYQPPSWFGEEVTENIEYSNFQLSINGLPEKIINQKMKEKERQEKIEELLNFEKVKTRGFEEVNYTHKKHDLETILPTRGSKNSAGYDIYSKETANIAPGTQHIFWTDIKSYMLKGEVLQLYVRSSIGIKKGLVLANGTGIIDQDYFENPKNDGNIGVCLRNESNEYQTIEKGDRIAQGIFIKFLPADNIISDKDRNGGIGSTD